MVKAKGFLKYMLIAGLVFGLFFGMGTGLANLMHSADTEEEVEKPENTEVAEIEEQDGERTNILMLGVDARPGEDHSRSDTMILVSIDPKLDKMAVISIPRDTRIKVKGSSNEKICTANFVGGPDYAKELVEQITSTKIDYYVEMDFNGFKEIIDTLGGVTINVPERMYKPAEGIDLYPGTQKLTGEKALGFVRYRDYQYGDIERTAQQQKFITALADQALKAKTITKIPGLFKHVKKYMDTDLGFTDIVRMVSWAPGFDQDSIITQTLPGYFYDELDEEGNLAQSYWIADKKVAAQLIDKMFAGEEVVAIQASPYPVRPKPQKTNEEEGEQESGDNVLTPEEQARINEQRSKLPSPGHNDNDIEISLPEDNTNPAPVDPTPADPTGPAGYI